MSNAGTKGSSRRTVPSPSARGASSVRGEAPGRGAGGFSLVEMLIGIVITGVVGAAVVGVVLEQSAFYQENSRLVTANSSLRSAADRMSSELRMVRQGDVLTAEADRLTVRFGTASGVVCEVSATTAYVYLHRLPDEDPETVRYLEPRFDGDWRTGLLWGALQEDSSEECASHGAPSGQPSAHYRRVGSWPTSSPEVGSLIYGTQRLTYEFELRGDRLVLARDGRQLAAPFREGAGPYFRYFRADGTELSSPVTGSSREEIATVRVEATALGHDPNQRFDGDRTIDLRIPFRN